MRDKEVRQRRREKDNKQAHINIAFGFLRRSTQLASTPVILVVFAQCILKPKGNLDARRSVIYFQFPYLNLVMHADGEQFTQQKPPYVSGAKGVGHVNRQASYTKPVALNLHLQPSGLDGACTGRVLPSFPAKVQHYFRPLTSWLWPPIE
jgi:hypothetical protein